MMRLTTLSIVLGFMVSASNGATLQVNGIHAFDTNLGTLNSVVVVLDPISIQTSSHSSSPFDSISNHAHIVAPLPVPVSTLGSFIFTPVQTSFSSAGLGETTHHHSANLLPSQKIFTGAALNWFFNPANSINTVSIPGLQTSSNEDHTHHANFFPIVPTTTYSYTPAIPEPTSAAILGLSLLAASGVGRRR